MKKDSVKTNIFWFQNISHLFKTSFDWLRNTSFSITIWCLLGPIFISFNKTILTRLYGFLIYPFHCASFSFRLGLHLYHFNFFVSWRFKTIGINLIVFAWYAWYVFDKWSPVWSIAISTGYSKSVGPLNNNFRIQKLRKMENYQMRKINQPKQVEILWRAKTNSDVNPFARNENWSVVDVKSEKITNSVFLVQIKMSWQTYKNLYKHIMKHLPKCYWCCFFVCRQRKMKKQSKFF